MFWMVWSLGLQNLTELYNHWTDYPETVLFLGVMVFLILRRNFRATLILAFGVALCYANYFVLKEYALLAIPPLYAVSFGAVSIVLLILLLFQFIHTT